MGLKTFNVHEESYRKYSEHCRKNGISMSKQIDKFIEQELSKIERVGEISSKTRDFEASKITRPNSVAGKEHGMSRYC